MTKENQDTILSQDIDQQYIQQWVAVQNRLKSAIGASAFDNWIAPLQLHDVGKNNVVLTTSQGYLCDWINNQYGKRIREFWLSENPNITHVDIIVDEQAKPRKISYKNTIAPKYQKNTPPRLNTQSPKPTLPKQPHQSIPQPRVGNGYHKHKESMIGFHIKDEMNFNNFFVNNTNESAWRSCKSLEDGAMRYNPIYIYGQSGVGKTHLLNAVAHHMQQKSHAKIIIVTSDQFMYYFVRSLQQKEAIAFKEELRCADYLFIDDVQFLNTNPNILLEFTHTLNSLLDRNKQIIVTGDRPPQELQDLDTRTRTRLAGGLVVEIEAPDVDLCTKIIRHKAKVFQWDIEPQAEEYLAYKFKSSLRELSGALNRLHHLQSFANNAKITLETCEKQVKDIISAPDKRISIEDIQDIVSEHYGIRRIEMQSARKNRDVVRPRQIAMYLSKQMTARSLPEIGRKFGGRDHSTVIYGIRRIEELLAKDAFFREELSHIRRIIEE